MAKYIRVVIVEPGKEPYIKVVENSLECLQKIVGGYIETIRPFGDEVILVCNEEGRLRGLSLNREIFDERGRRLDYIVGTFFLTYCRGEDFEDLPLSLAEKCLKEYALKGEK